MLFSIAGERLERGSTDAIGARIRGGILALVGELTPGQRWTTGLTTGLAVLILAFGLPSTTRTVLGGGGPLAQAARDETTSDSALGDTTGPASTPEAPEPAPRPSSGVTPAGTGGPAPVDADGTDEVEAGPGGPSLSERRSVLAIADPSSAVPGREDAAIALHFVLEVGLNAAVETADDVERVCAVASRVDLVLASGALPAGVVSCLASAGVVVVSWDDAVAAGDSDTALSTRRGAATSLLDTASELDLAGRSALVADERLRASLEPATGRAAGLGLTFSETIWLDGEAGPDVALGLASANLDHVVFATSTRNQSTIATQLAVFAPGVDYVILDAADSVVNGNTSPALDGARAVTAVQYPWHVGNEGLRSACVQSWEQAQSPPATIDQAEVLRVLQWCQHVRLGAELLEILGAGGPPSGVRGASPLTTALGPLGANGFGPTRITTANWAADCSCWSTSESFEEPA